jgi:hypothetical protein
MKFTPPTDEDMHIALTSGHSIVIKSNGGEGTEVPALFAKEAIARGAEPVGIEKAAPLEGKTYNRAQVIKDAMTAMLDGDEEDNFTNDGKPDLRKLKGITGFHVAREEADKVFAELADESSADQE